MAIHFGPDVVDDAVRGALQELEAGRRPHERTLVDLKEEAGRRNAQGAVGPGTSDNVRAADALVAEAACMANSSSGGALIVGAADDGELLGAALDGEWLKHRIYEKLGRQLTVSVREAYVHGIRLLVVRSPEAVEPIRWNGKIRWRLGDHCVEVDASTWHASRRLQTRFDWSAQASTVPVARVRPAAVEIARDFLRASTDPDKQELAEVDTPTLLRRLNAAVGDGHLTNAAVLVFLGRDSPCLDYVRRDVSGGDSTARVRRGGRSVLEDLAEVFTTVRANNPIQHTEDGLVIGQTRRIPERAVREAIVNGLAHREWGLESPTLVEHIGGTLRVTSPGGFFGGVSEQNIITHPSDSRNTAMTELLAAVGVAEREGIGVDRMVGDMLRLGYQEPDIIEIPGPYVNTSLVSGVVDTAWIAWLARLENENFRRDLRLLMCLRWIVTHGWLDVPTVAPYLQLPEGEAADAVQALTAVKPNSAPVLVPVEGVPADSAWPAYRLSDRSRALLREEDERRRNHRPTPSRELIAIGFASARGRISSTELASLVGAFPSNVGDVLKQLEKRGRLEPSRESRRGAGFYYRAVRE